MLDFANVSSKLREQVRRLCTLGAVTGHWELISRGGQQAVCLFAPAILA